jgi:hypothetical protein
VSPDKDTTPEIDIEIGRRKTGMHLYVMQSATGRIKIGRSSNPKLRRLNLQSAIGQPLFLLKVFKNRGTEERVIHDKLAEWREFGEWFTNSGPCRQAIGEAIGAQIGFKVFEVCPSGEAISKAVTTINNREKVESAFEELVIRIRSEGSKRHKSLR